MKSTTDDKTSRFQRLGRSLVSPADPQVPPMSDQPMLTGRYGFRPGRRGVWVLQVEWSQVVRNEVGETQTQYWVDAAFDAVRTLGLGRILTAPEGDPCRP